MATVSEETKKRIESMTDEEIEFEINLGRRSHFQRESFAWLQTVKSQRDKLAQKTRDEENDAMMRAFHGVPVAHKLETMPDIDLAELQSRIASDSPGKTIIENEWQRRKSIKAPTPTEKPQTIIQKINLWYRGNEVELIPVKNGNFVDIYARYEKSTSARVASGLVNFWLAHWKILLPVIVSIIGIIVAAGVSLYIHFDSKKSKGETTQKYGETPKQMRTEISQPLVVHKQFSSTRTVTRPQR